MKLRVTRRECQMQPERVEAQAIEPFEPPSSASYEEKKERLYSAIERAQAFLHKRVPPDDVMASVRRWFPEPMYFVESGRQTMGKTGIGQLDAFYYAMIPNLTRTSLSQQWGTNPKLSTLSGMAKYLRTLYVGLHVEHFYLILLNGQGRLIRPVMLQKGTVDSTPFYLSQVLSVILLEEAKYIVLAHNHPGGTRRPSQQDLSCTLRAMQAIAPLKISLLDHIIVVPDGAVSIRESGLIPDILWDSLCPNSRWVREWKDVELLAQFKESKS